ncbi:MAG: hypothetical protein ACYDC1_04120, partial [Limisphaerales bacterium]
MKSPFPKSSVAVVRPSFVAILLGCMMLAVSPGARAVDYWVDVPGSPFTGTLTGNSTNNPMPYTTANV